MKKLLLLLSLLCPVLLWAQNDRGVFRSLESALKSPKDVKVLNLAASRLEAVPKEVAMFPNLEELVLFNNRIADLSATPELFQCSKLRVLNLFKNDIKVIPAEIAQLTELRDLSLGSNLLDSVSPEIGQLTKLVRLSLQYNYLYTLPASIGNLTNVHELRLNNNNLLSVPDELAQMANLEILDISQNRIDSIPRRIGDLKKLKFFYLSYNRIPVLPPSLCDLTAMQELDVVRCGIFRLPDDLQYLERLDRIYIDERTLVPFTRYRTNRRIIIIMPGNMMPYRSL